MVVRERAAGLQDFIPGDIFEFEIELVWVRNSLVINTKIEIDAYARPLDLRHAGCHKGLARQTALLVLIGQTALHVLA